MKYFIIDAATGKIVSIHETQHEVIYQWIHLTLNQTAAFRPTMIEGKRHLGDFYHKCYTRNFFSFDELNVTGKDKHWEYILTDSYGLQFVLKKYMVLDENNRHIDLRNWSTVIEAVCRNPDAYAPASKYSDSYVFEAEFRNGPCDDPRATRNHCHRAKGLTGWNQKKRETEFDIIDEVAALDDEEFGNVNFANARIKTRSKDFDVFDDWCIAEKRLYSRLKRNTCWKDSKTGKQWAKHKKKCNIKAVRRGKSLKDLDFIDNAEMVDEVHTATKDNPRVVNKQLMMTWLQKALGDEIHESIHVIEKEPAMSSDRLDYIELLTFLYTKGVNALKHRRFDE